MQGGASKNTSWLKARALNMNFDLSKSEYKAIENIGTGAYGVVCSAVQVRTGKKFAIKKIPNAFGELITAKRTFRELKILRHFDHENVIRIHEILMPREPLSEFSDVYVVMDLMESDLHQILHSTQPFTDEHTRYFLYQILRGLKYIHSANVVHRDLKPSNLLVNQNCELKIGDFGMARGMSSKLDSKKKLFMTQYVATRWYRAPELLFSAYNYKQSVDMWSVGCIFAEMITRRQIFPGKNPVDQLSLIMNVLGLPPDSMLKSAGSDQITAFFRKQFGGRTPIGLKEKVKGATPDALSLLSKMLAFEPEERISIEGALSDVYVNNYHDPDDEPLCLPQFDFSFDDQPMTTDQIRQQVGKMILKYSRQKMFALKVPAAGSGSLTPKSTQPLIPASKLTPASENPLSKEVLHQLSDEGTSVDGPVVGLKRVTEKNNNPPPVDLKQSPPKPVTPPSFQPVQDPNTTTLASDHVTSDVEMKSARSACNEAVKNILSITAKNQTDSKGKTDVEMMSAKKNDGSLEVPGDVHMLSAKAEKPVVLKESSASKHEERNEREAAKNGSLGTLERTEDTKALIKAALKHTVLMKSKLKKEFPGEPQFRPPPPRKLSLAQTRQKEREEKRRQRYKRAKDKQRSKKAKQQEGGKSLLLTDADRNLLEKWKGMQNKEEAAVSTNQMTAGTTTVQSQGSLNLTVNLNPTVTTAGLGVTSKPVIFTLGDSPIFTGTNAQNLILLPVNSIQGNLTSGTGPLIPNQNAAISVLGRNSVANVQRTIVQQGPRTRVLKPVNQRVDGAPSQICRDSDNLPSDGLSNFSDITSLLLDSPDQEQEPFSNDVFLGTGSQPVAMGRGHYRTDVYKSTPSPPSFLPATGSNDIQYHGGPVRDAATPPDMNAITDQLARAAVLEDPLPYLQLTPRGDGTGYGLGVNLEDFLSCEVGNSQSQDDSGDLSKCTAEGQLSASVLSGILREHDINPDDLHALHQELGLTSPITLEHLTQLSPTTVVASP